MNQTVCLVTTGHLSTNPRLVKEADALADAGYTVRVVAARFWPWADVADASFAARPWMPLAATVSFGALASPGRRLWHRVAGLAARVVARRVALDGLRIRALHPAATMLVRETCRVRADLYIAHNLAALPAAAAAAHRHRARLQFDAEDFHRGEVNLTPETAVRLALTEQMEERLIPRCDAVTAASDGIAEAYASALGIARPTTILNVFPASDRSVRLPQETAAAERAPGTRTLYWFSQTIGDDRGLEDVLEALTHLPASVHLVLRGTWAPAYEAQFRARARLLGVADRIRVLMPTSPDEMVARAALHDIGLALEQPRTRNRDLCLTNKAFTYLLGGVPVIATNTTGQQSIAREIPEAIVLVPPGDAEALATAARHLLADATAREAAACAARRYTWEAERERFLEVVRRVLA